MLGIANILSGQIGINTDNPQGLFHIDPNQDNKNSNNLTRYSEDIIVHKNGQISIGNINPSNSAIVDLSATDRIDKKGFLGPRVNLTSLTDTMTIPSPSIGLLIYNLGQERNFDYKGFLYWDGTEWKKFDNKINLESKLGELTCDNIKIKPLTYTLNQPYLGQVEIPYSNGNNGTYNAEELGPFYGIKANLPAGKLKKGSGVLKYTLSGTPTGIENDNFSFDINFQNKSCRITLGEHFNNIEEKISYVSEGALASAAGWMSDLLPNNDLPIIDGKLQVDMYYKNQSNGGNLATSVYPALVNISDKPIKIWVSGIATSSGFSQANYIIAAKSSTKSYIYLDKLKYLNTGQNHITTVTNNTSATGEGGNQEFMHFELFFDDKWYRLHYFIIVDNLNTSTKDDNTRIAHVAVEQLY